MEMVQVVTKPMPGPVVLRLFLCTFFEPVIYMEIYDIIWKT